MLFRFQPVLSLIARSDSAQVCGLEARFAMASSILNVDQSVAWVTGSPLKA
jgi:hypothetical protein